ncbi:hypothetical protein V502_09321 [Pseudogymnoascus sp. VKM F-4520 (FW-2644)]|nr:hypothetical protein V502_09321 [Pseudogymnoascus sp. VKM F-4520 (FW-2644)]
MGDVFGIKELYNPTEKPVADIVAVHGLNGDRIKSWTSESGDTCWLKHPDFLPKYIQQCRVLTWGYNANISTLTGKTTSSDRILQHAQTLIAQLHADRDLNDANERPIIFLCHSMGGIVALAYSASRSAANISHLQSIYNCTFGILFFGTPHSGSSKARLLDNLIKVVSIALPTGKMESGLVNALKEESETLRDITDQFAPLMSRFRIYFFWEQERMDLKYTKDYVVEEPSAAPILDNTERCGIAADHRGMIKFDDNELQGFRTVMSALKRYSSEAPRVIEDRLKIAAQALGASRWNEAMELTKTAQPFAPYQFPQYYPSSDEVATQQLATYPFMATSQAPMPINSHPNRKDFLIEDLGTRQRAVGNEAEDRPIGEETVFADSSVKY